MPTVYRLGSIQIIFRFNDHAPPHFHVEYGKSKASFAIDDLRVLAGNLPPKIHREVMEWATPAPRRQWLINEWAKHQR